MLPTPMALSKASNVFQILQVLLAQAIRTNDRESVDKLLMVCSPIRQHPFTRISDLLQIAIKLQRCRERIKLLLSKGAVTSSSSAIAKPTVRLISKSGQSLIDILRKFIDLEVRFNERARSLILELTVERGMMDVVKFLINSGVDLSIIDKLGDHLVHMLIKYVAKQNNGIRSNDRIRDFAKWMNREKADVASAPQSAIDPNAHGQSKLHVALAKFYDAKFGYADNEENSAIIVEMIDKMLNEGADVNVVDKNGNTPVHIAAKQKNDRLIRMMLRRFSNVNAQSNWGETVLHIFVRNSIDANGKFEKHYDQYVHTLLSRGADVNIKNGKGMTAAQLAIQHRHDKIFKILADNGANLRVRTEDGDDLFQLLIRSSADEPAAYKNILDVLLDNGYDIDEVDRNGQTFLHRATMWGDLQLVKALLEKGAKVNCIDRSSRRLTPLHIGIQFRDESVSVTLLNNGADMNVLTKDGESSLLMATKKNQLTLVSRLLMAGVNVNFVSKHGESALIRAARNSESSLIELLLDYGADVNLCDDKTRVTALHVAAAENRQNVVDLLMKAGADVNARNALGQTPLHFAARHRNEMLENLVKSGGKPYLLDSQNRSCLHETVNANNLVGLDYLLKIGQNINELGRVRLTMNSLLSSDKTHAKVRTQILQRLVELHAVDLLEPRLDKAYIDMCCEYYHRQCQEEVMKLKNESIGDVSLYDYIRMRPKRRMAYAKHFTFWYPNQFPIYYSLVKRSLDEAYDRKKLLVPAVDAWYDITKVMLPEICVERILDFTRLDTLKMLVQHDEDC